MKTSAVPSYAGYRFPAEVISHAVWLYFRFPLSLRMVDELLAARGIIVSHETVRFRALNAPMSRLACAANTHGDELAAQDQQQISNLHWLLAAILGALTLCSFCLTGAHLRHNRLLT